MNHGHSPGAGQPETPKLPHTVFISYSSQDKVTAMGSVPHLKPTVLAVEYWRGGSGLRQLFRREGKKWGPAR
jgi:hypothetical protein